MYKVNIEDYKGYHQERKAKAWNNLIDIVNNSNYKLLDNFENYKNNSIKLKFQCDKNHVFYTTLGNFKNNSRRCPICSGRKSLHKDGFLGEIKDICRDIDYTLISTEYKNSKSKLNFKCSENHIFQMTTSNFKFGQRCPYCAGFKSTHINGFLGEIQDICKKINYTLISKNCFKLVTAASTNLCLHS